ncbi:MAG: hypothetical protein A3E01_09380 [Gammaproteobacteria bacterium RIFCSPHIGHO2_12_FULL_63_22]|nr:MAG: hypothetical protein A3E01_09380 [Gammaproteobacteria bacterium RIFCSPHIGHO2_12_FULL_63_22]
MATKQKTVTIQRLWWQGKKPETIPCIACDLPVPIKIIPKKPGDYSLYCDKDEKTNMNAKAGCGFRGFLYANCYHCADLNLKISQL